MTGIECCPAERRDRRVACCQDKRRERRCPESMRILRFHLLYFSCSMTFCIGTVSLWEMGKFACALEPRPALRPAAHR